MVVQVLQKRRQPRLRPSAKFSVLGDGLLERTRSTTFALLGATAAVGLAVIGIALQEDWPLVAGSAIPRPPVVHESVGEATALGAKRSPGAPHGGPAPRTRRVGSGGRAAPDPGAAPVASAPAAPATSTEAVSSPAAQAKPQGGTGRGGRSHDVPAAPKTQAPAAPQPSQAPSVVAPSTQPSASPAKVPAPTPVPPQPSPPEPVASEAPPVEPAVPPWSHGEGHAYGREVGDHGHGPGAPPGLGDD